MSLWAKLGGIAVGAVGAATGNPLLIGAGVSIIGADVAADAGKKAADQQIAASERAQADTNTRYDAAAAQQKAAYEQSTAGFAPFTALGQGALPNLGAMVGLSPSQFTPSTAAPTTPAAPAPQTLGQIGAPGQGGVRNPGAGLVAPGTQQARAAGLSGSAYQGPETKAGRSLSQVGSGLVQVASPDGAEQRWLTRREADRAVAAGGKEIG
jgi:hypothetical protein